MTRLALLAGMTVLAAASTRAHAVQPVNGEGSTLAIPTENAEFGIFPLPAFQFQGYLSSGTRGFAALKDNAGSGGVPPGVPVDFAASEIPVTANQVFEFSNVASDTAGRLIQIPMLGTAIAIPFKNPAYTGALGSAIKMTDADLCGIFSGKATRWDLLSPLARGGSRAHFDVIYDKGNSGESYLLTQHLKLVCTTANSRFTSVDLASMPRFDFYNLSIVPSLTESICQRPPTQPVVDWCRSGAPGDGSVAAVLEASTSAIGFLAPNYTSVPATPVPGHGSLLAASLRSPNGTYYQPSFTNTSAAISGRQVGGANLVAPSTNIAAADPTRWVPSLPRPQTGYPLVGFSAWQLATCYGQDKAAGLVSFLKAHFRTNGPLKTTITNNGMLPVTNSGYLTALNNYILGNARGANLDIGNATACAGKAGR